MAVKKPVQIVVCRVGQKAVVESLENSLEAMQKIVGGYIECVNIAPGVDLWCNEEGKNNNLPFNLRAPSDPMYPRDVIAGDFFIVSTRNGGMMSLSEKNIAKYLAEFADPAMLLPT